MILFGLLWVIKLWSNWSNFRPWTNVIMYSGVPICKFIPVLFSNISLNMHILYNTDCPHYQMQFTCKSINWVILFYYLTYLSFRQTSILLHILIHKCDQKPWMDRTQWVKKWLMHNGHEVSWAVNSFRDSQNSFI